jgi:outer membrane protein assembly factor BamA
MNLLVEADYRTPNNIRNYFGLGNETENTETQAEFYQARLATGLLSTSLELTGETGASITLGGHLRYTHVKNEADRFVGQQGISSGSFSDQFFLGLDGGLRFDRSDHRVNPRQGFIWNNEADLNVGISSSDALYTTLLSTLSFYISPSLSPQLTVATRIGMAHTIGDFPFYAANTVGGVETVRGWRNNRFAGRTSFYTNAEVRARLFGFSTYVAAGEMGVLGFFDNGRVWTESDEIPGRIWHQGYGGGLWVSLFDALVVSGTLGFSKEEESFNLRLGFLY